MTARLTLPVLPTTTVGDCCTSCQKTAGCNSFQYCPQRGGCTLSGGTLISFGACQLSKDANVTNGLPPAWSGWSGALPLISGEEGGRVDRGWERLMPCAGVAHGIPQNHPGASPQSPPTPHGMPQDTSGRPRRRPTLSQPPLGRLDAGCSRRDVGGWATGGGVSMRRHEVPLVQVPATYVCIFCNLLNFHHQ